MSGIYTKSNERMIREFAAESLREIEETYTGLLYPFIEELEILCRNESTHIVQSYYALLSSIFYHYCIISIHLAPSLTSFLSNTSNNEAFQSVDSPGETPNEEGLIYSSTSKSIPIGGSGNELHDSSSSSSMGGYALGTSIGSGIPIGSTTMDSLLSTPVSLSSSLSTSYQSTSDLDQSTNETYENSDSNESRLSSSFFSSPNYGNTPGGGVAVGSLNQPASQGKVSRGHSTGGTGSSHMIGVTNNLSEEQKYMQSYSTSSQSMLQNSGNPSNFNSFQHAKSGLPTKLLGRSKDRKSQIAQIPIEKIKRYGVIELGNYISGIGLYSFKVENKLVSIPQRIEQEVRKYVSFLSEALPYCTEWGIIYIIHNLLNTVLACNFQQYGKLFERHFLRLQYSYNVQLLQLLLIVISNFHSEFEIHQNSVIHKVLLLINNHSIPYEYKTILLQWIREVDSTVLRSCSKLIEKNIIYLVPTIFDHMYVKYWKLLCLFYFFHNNPKLVNKFKIAVRSKPPPALSSTHSLGSLQLPPHNPSSSLSNHLSQSQSQVQTLSFAQSLTHSQQSFSQPLSSSNPASQSPTFNNHASQLPPIGMHANSFMKNTMEQEAWLSNNDKNGNSGNNVGNKRSNNITDILLSFEEFKYFPTTHFSSILYFTLIKDIFLYQQRIIIKNQRNNVSHRKSRGGGEGEGKDIENNFYYFEEEEGEYENEENQEIMKIINQICILLRDLLIEDSRFNTYILHLLNHPSIIPSIKYHLIIYFQYSILSSHIQSSNYSLSHSSRSKIKYLTQQTGGNSSSSSIQFNAAPSSLASQYSITILDSIELLVEYLDILYYFTFFNFIKPIEIIDCLTHLLRKSNILMNGEWSIGNKILLIIKSIILHFDISIVFQCLEEILFLLCKQYNDIEIRDRSLFYYQLITHISSNQIIHSILNQSNSIIHETTKLSSSIPRSHLPTSSNFTPLSSSSSSLSTSSPSANYSASTLVHPFIQLSILDNHYNHSLLSSSSSDSSTTTTSASSIFHDFFPNEYLSQLINKYNEKLLPVLTDDTSNQHSLTEGDTVKEENTESTSTNTHSRKQSQSHSKEQEDEIEKQIISELIEYYFKKVEDEEFIGEILVTMKLEYIDSLNKSSPQSQSQSHSQSATAAPHAHSSSPIPSPYHSNTPSPFHSRPSSPSPSSKPHELESDNENKSTLNHSSHSSHSVSDSNDASSRENEINNSGNAMKIPNTQENDGKATIMPDIIFSLLIQLTAIIESGNNLYLPIPFLFVPVFSKIKNTIYLKVKIKPIKPMPLYLQGYSSFHDENSKLYIMNTENVLLSFAHLLVEFKFNIPGKVSPDLFYHSFFQSIWNKNTAEDVRSLLVLHHSSSTILDFLSQSNYLNRFFIYQSESTYSPPDYSDTNGNNNNNDPDVTASSTAGDSKLITRNYLAFLPSSYHLCLKFKIHPTQTICKIKTDFWYSLSFIDSLLNDLLESHLQK